MPCRFSDCRIRQAASVRYSTSVRQSILPRDVLFEVSKFEVTKSTRKNQFPPQAMSPVTEPSPPTSITTSLATRYLETFSKLPRWRRQSREPRVRRRSQGDGFPQPSGRG